MPGKVKVKIIAGRNLPVMDRSSDTTDAYVEIKLGTTTYKTDVCRKSLHPQWNSEWYRFEADDAELQDEPLQIRLMDHDTYSANDAIGKVYLDLNPLLLPATNLLGTWSDGNNLNHEGSNSVMAGWIPVFDTMHGIRGEVNVVVKVDLFSDFNRFRQSSCGVQFFSSPTIPHGFYAQVIHGFVEELVVNDDPEYQWIDKIRTPRASNEARQTLFFKLSGELQRKIGLKALEMGGNAVIGYNQCFDLEGESGIVARGIGTAITLLKILDLPSPNPETGPNEERAQSYLKFLGSAKGFYLHNDSNTHFIHSLCIKSPTLKIPSPSVSMKSLKLDKHTLKPERLPRHLLTRHLSDKEFNFSLPPYHSEHVLHHSVSLQTLLKQEDMRGKPGYGITQRFKNLKHSSQHIISRKMTALKAKLSADQDAEVSRGRTRSLRYRRTQSDNSGMAEILVRSVFHAATSLDCIAESPKLSISEEETKDSFLSLPTPAADADSASSNLSGYSDDDDEEEEDDDEDEDEYEDEGDTIEPLEELDTVSLIVENVRKLSMIQGAPESEEAKSKFLFVLGGGIMESTESTSLITDELPEEHLLYYEETGSTDSKLIQSFFPQFAKAFNAVKKSTTASSLSGILDEADARDNTLSRKFTSLHNIHDAGAKFNKYSAHDGKETVLGELFRRIDNALPYSMQTQSEIALHDHFPNLSTPSIASDTHLLRNAAADTKLKCELNTSQAINTTGHDNGSGPSISESRGHQGESLNIKTKPGTTNSGFLSRKVMSALHKFDAVIHRKEALKNKTEYKHHKAKSDLRHEHGLINMALENVLMDSAKEVMATSSPKSPPDAQLFNYPQAESQTPESPRSETQEHHHESLLHKIKEGTDKLMHKMHHPTSDGKITNEHGLLNMALGNVLMDSMQDVLATSHSASPQSPSSQGVFFPMEESTKKSKESLNSSDHEVRSLAEENISEHHHTSLLHKIKEGKNKIMHKIEEKMHDSSDGKITNDHGLLNMALGNVLMDSMQDVLATSHTASPQSPPSAGTSPFFPSEETKTKTKESLESNDTEIRSLTEEHHHTSLLHKLKEGKDKIMHKIEGKKHDTSDGKITNDHGLLNMALGNVLMDSVQDVLATSHSASPQSPSSAGISPFFPTDSPKTTSKESLSKVTDEEESQLEKFIESDYHKHRHSFMERLKERKNKLLHGSKELLHRLDAKLHEGSKPKNEPGLLNIALENVLMDSMQDVLATSHSDQSKNPPSTQSPSITPIFAQCTTYINKELNTANTKCLVTQSELQPDTKNCAGRTSNTQIECDQRECINTQHACLTPPRNTTSTSPKDVRAESTGVAQMPITSSSTNTTTTSTGTPTTGVTPISAVGHQRTESLGVRIAHSPAKLNAIPCIHRRSSDSDLSITPKGFVKKRNSLTGSDRSGGYSSGQFARGGGAMIRTTRPQENLDIMEYPFLTLSRYPMGFIAHIGGSVSARSVKLLERISNLEEPESRDTWWSEIRMEIRSHAKALNCNAVLGYTESTSICEDVCVLSASGTAAVLSFQYATESTDKTAGAEKTDTQEKHTGSKIKPPPATGHTVNISPERDPATVKASCNLCHLPYFGNSKPLRTSSIKCLVCGAFKVPDVMLATIEMPEGMLNVGRGCFIQSYVCRPLRDVKGESNAKEISDGLPFLEYELHRFLINKLKVKAMNAIFGLKVRISIGERMMIGIATGTAVFLSPLPPPLLPKLVSDRTVDEKKLNQLQRNLHETIKKNRELYQLCSLEELTNGSLNIKDDTDDSEDEQANMDLAMGNKDCCILEVDDPDDVDVLNSLMEPRPPEGFHVVNTELVPGLEDMEIVKNLQMFTQIWRSKISPPLNLDKHFHRLLQSVYFKLRRMIPCALCDMQFRVNSPEPDEIQLCVIGMALGLGDAFKNPKKRKNVLPKRNEDDLIFNLEEDQIPEESIVPTTSGHLPLSGSKHRQKSPVRNRFLTRQRHVPYRERHGVDITPLSYVPGGKIEKYLGNLNFFFIRETTSLREEGGLSGFIHSFVTEVLAIVRAHVTALGGNAMVAYFLTECVLNHNLHKNQGQCLVNVGGDVVFVSYFNEDA